MTGPDHYVPVLKVKRGEKKALQCISARLQPRITPLLEIVERKPDKDATVDEHLNTSFKDLAESVRPYPRCFLDAHEIEVDRASAAAEVFRRASNEGIVFTPVTGISRTTDVEAALSNRTHGIALRLTRQEFEVGGLGANIKAFLRLHSLTPHEVDIIIDLGGVDDFIVDGISALTDGFMADVPDQLEWRTFTVSSCAFPLSMGGVDRHSHEFVERAEWMAWKDRLFTRRHGLSRLPTFSDCAIQHPRGVEGFDFRTMQVSASVRYTLSEQWLLIKGESTRVVPPVVQFPRLATRLVYGHLRRHFAGEDHCAGCASIKRAADGAPGFGSPEVWRRIGTIHHITKVMEGLAALPCP